MKAAKVFYARREGWTGTSGLKRMGVILVCMGVVGIFISAGIAGLFGAGVVSLVAAHWLESNPIVTLHGDHMEMKVAIAAPRKLILFADIEKLVRQSAKKVHLHTKQGKKVALPIASLDDKAADELVTALQRRVAA